MALAFSVTELLTLQTLLIFLVASISLAIVPGPDNIFVLTQSAMHGRRAGLMVMGRRRVRPPVQTGGLGRRR